MFVYKKKIYSLMIITLVSQKLGGMAAPAKIPVPSKIIAKEQSQSYIDLDKATDIVIEEFIKKDRLFLLYGADESELALKNLTPASHAFIAEVLRSQIPVLLYCFTKGKDGEWENEIKKIESFAKKMQGKLKIVVIDLQKLPSVFPHNFEQLPLAIVIHKGKEIGTAPLSLKNLSAEIEKFANESLLKIK